MQTQYSPNLVVSERGSGFWWKSTLYLSIWFFISQKRQNRSWRMEIYCQCGRLQTGNHNSQMCQVKLYFDGKKYLFTFFTAVCLHFFQKQYRSLLYLWWFHWTFSRCYRMQTDFQKTQLFSHWFWWVNSVWWFSNSNSLCLLYQRYISVQKIK